MKISILRNLALALTLSACASTQSTLPGLVALDGAWDGSFDNVTTGHGTKLHLNINDQSSAQVLMIANQWMQRGTRYWEENTIQQPQLIAASVERLDGGRVRLQTQSYRDVSCGCDVSIQFIGKVANNNIDGTVIGTTPTGNVMFEGSWKVTRTLIP
jgi:hypothetical protein